MAKASNESLKKLSMPIDSLIPNPNQPRKYFDEEALNELTSSIKSYGVLQPIIYFVDENNKNIIVAGERRFRASQSAGLTEIPAICIDGKNSDKIAIIENLLRQDFTPLEEAEALQNLKDKYSYSHERLATILSRSRTTITEILSLNKLPDKIKEDCRNRIDISKCSLVQIARKKTEEKQIEMYEKISKSQIVPHEEKTNTVFDTKRIVSFMNTLQKEFQKSDVNIPVEEREGLKNNLNTLINNINNFMGMIDNNY